MFSEKEILQLIEEKKRLELLVKKQSKIISEKEATICKKKETISHLEVSILENKTLIERLRRMLFGQKRERFEHLDNQLDIFSLISAEVKEELQKEVG